MKVLQWQNEIAAELDTTRTEITTAKALVRQTEEEMQAEAAENRLLRDTFSQINGPSLAAALRQRLTDGQESAPAVAHRQAVARLAELGTRCADLERALDQLEVVFPENNAAGA